MTKVEVMGAVGELRVGDVQTVLGGGARAGASIEVLILAVDDGAPFVGSVSLGLMRKGRTMHLGLVCAACRLANRSLFVGEDNKLGCRRCLHRLTRHQAERTLRTWRKCGGREEDRLQRLIRRGDTTPAGLRAARRLGVELLEGDRDRTSSAIELATAALIATKETR
jgi:hypothetical protein